jgi:hypothetical protein
MAKNVGLVQIEGTIGGITFKKGGIMSKAVGSRTVNSAETKKNNAEFGNATSVASLFYKALAYLTWSGGSKNTYPRVVKKMTEAIYLDGSSVKGERNVLDGELSVFEGFEYNSGQSVSGIFNDFLTGTIDRPTGACVVAIPAFVPTQALKIPTGATHAKFVAQAAGVDFEMKEFETKKAETGYIPLNGTMTAGQSLTCDLSNASTHPIFLGVAIDFYQYVNGTHSILDNSAYNVATILKVDTGV